MNDVKYRGMKLVYEYEESMRQCETLLAKYRTKLLTYSKCQEPSLSESDERNDVLAVIKKKLDTAGENLTTLKSEYDYLNVHNQSMSLSEDDFANKFFKYLERQEALRLRFIQIIDECKRVNFFLDNIRDDCSSAAVVPELHESKSSEMCADFKIYDHLSSDIGEDVAAEEFNAATLLGLEEVKEFVSSNQNVIPISCAEMSAVFKTYDAWFSDIVDDEFNPTTFLGLHEVTKFAPLNRNVDVVSNLNQLTICYICGRDFKTEDVLRRHKFAHDESKRFIYAESIKSFAKKLDMKDHVLEYNSKYICIVCGKSFHCKVELKKHELAHFFRKLLKCSTCRKYFKSRSALTAHQWSHEWQLYCAYCNRRFKSKLSLTDHIKRDHLPIDSFEKVACRICGDKFTLDTTRIRHERNIHRLRRNDARVSVLSTSSIPRLV